ncbi:MAG: DsbA family protein [Candidatus Micrarchaeota archaeon]
MRMEEHMHKKDNNEGLYAVAIAIVVSVIILSGVIVYAANSMNSNLGLINTNMQNLKLNVNVQGGSQQLQGTSTPQATATPQPQPNQLNVVLDDTVPMKGNKDAKITIIEYSDFQCPYCERFISGAYPSILSDWIDTGKAKIYFKQFPLAQIHPYAEKAAEATLCAEEQGKFWEMHDKLFANQNALTVDDLKKYAADLKLDTAKFNACLDGGTKAADVNAELQEGVANGVTGTPSFFINGEQVVGAQPYAAFQQVLQKYA